MARRATRSAVKAVPPPKVRVAARLTKVAAPRNTSARKLDLDGLSAEQKIALLLREREKMVTQLDAVQAKIATLEARDAQLADRIAWALDTLNDLLRDNS